ncbi:hypothetical protein [Pectobacterium aroidearum]|uniref:hypothetical protein n=1 Tax=Pectobacterium aroidearum TaxID=1201031 RepID=UPI0030166CEB
MSDLSGGEKLQKYLEEMEKNLSTGSGLKVGFLEGATYPDGTSVPMVAAVNEFGGSINIPARTHTIYRKVNEKTGNIDNYRFVKASKANLAQEVQIPAYTITVPPRPYFRNMIADKSPGWGNQMGKIMVETNYDAKKSLSMMGEVIQSQLKESIISLEDPPNAYSTSAKKGFNDPLIDSGHMLNTVDYEVGEDV